MPMTSQHAAAMPNNQNPELLKNPNTQTRFFKIMRRVFQTVDFFAPKLAAKWLYKLWFKTKHRDLRPAEKPLLTDAKQQTLKIKDWQIKTYHWQGQGPTILLAHGWGSVGLSFYALISALQKQNYNIVSFDGPGHGQSSHNYASLFDHAKVVAAVGQHFGPIHAAIGHSAGGVCLSMALNDGLTANKAVTIGSPNRVVRLVDDMCHAIGLSEKAVQHFKWRFEQRFGKTVWEDASTGFNMSKQKIPGLVIHDKLDNEILCEASDGIHQAWTNSELIQTEGLGHKKILADPKVIERILEFIPGIPDSA